MMRLLVLGATGQTGQHLLSQALALDHHVTALVRTPSKIVQKHERLAVETCDVFDREQLQPHINQCDVVISCLGFPIQFTSAVPHFVTVEGNVSECMRVAGKRRVIFMHSWYTDPASRDRCQGFVLRMFVKYFIGNVLEGMRQSELELEKSDHLDWTCVLPGGLTNEPVTDIPFRTNDTDFHIPGCSDGISRADVARYFLQVIPDTESHGKVRAIALAGESGTSLGETLSNQMGDFKRTTVNQQ